MRHFKHEFFLHFDTLCLTKDLCQKETGGPLARVLSRLFDSPAQELY